MNIVSLLPSATEIICALGLRDRLVGVTHACDHPADVVGLPVVTQHTVPCEAASAEIDRSVREQLPDRGSLYSLDWTLLEGLQPEIIVTQSLCEVCAVSEAEIGDIAVRLSSRPEVVNLEPMCLQDMFDTVRLVGAACDRDDASAALISALEARVRRVAERTAALDEARHPRVVFLEWLEPPFNAGHWTPELIELAGGVDCLGNRHRPSRTIAWEAICQADPDVLFISCCGFSVARAFKDLPGLTTRPGWDALSCVRNRRVYAADGAAYFNRPGPRLVDSLEILAHALHPDFQPLPPGLPSAVHALA